MKVVHLSTYSSGGAAIAATRLHLQLYEKGVDSTIIYLYKHNSTAKKSLDFRDALSPFRKLVLKIKNKLLLLSQNKQVNDFGKAPEFFSFPETVWDISEHPEIKKADIIHFHWVANFIDYRSLNKELFKNKKLIWTLHDLNSFSGGFHYTGWFETEPWKNLSDTNLKSKTSALTGLNIQIVAPSLWIKKTSENNELFKSQKHFHIKNPSSSLFAYTDKKTARQKLSIDTNKRVCFIPGDNPDYLRKGLTMLEKKLQGQNTNILFITTGKRALELGTNKQMHVGLISDESKMALYFSAADFMIFPSLEENFSNTLVEAVLCGCPVFCFDTGGNSEIIKDSSYGQIIRDQNWDAFIIGINELNFSEPERKKLAEQSAIEFSSEKAISEMIALYKD